jgi:hypothetical protein
MIKAKILRIEKKPSKYSSTLPFYYIFFKTLDGRSLKTCASPIYRNYMNWSRIVDNATPGETWLDGLITKTVRGEEIVDADSVPRIIEPIETPEIISKKPFVVQQELFAPGCRERLHEAMSVIGG